MEYCLKGHFNIKSRTSYLYKEVGQKCSVHTAASFLHGCADMAEKPLGPSLPRFLTLSQILSAQYWIEVQTRLKIEPSKFFFSPFI